MIIITPRKKKLPNKLKFGGWRLEVVGTWNNTLIVS
jgi:hypothetical protein